MSDPFEQAKSLFIEGVGAFEAGRYDAAEAAFEASLALLPGRVSTLGNLGAARVRLGKPEAALAVLEQALAAEPDDLDALSHKGAALADLGRHAEAITCHDRVLALEPRRAANWFRRGISLAATGRHVEALQSLDTFLGLVPGDAVGWWRRGETLQQLERHDEALASYEKALAFSPTLGEAWSRRGSILRDRERLDEAAVSFEQAIAAGADPEMNRYFLASVTGQKTPERAPLGYVGPLFDEYAETFDSHLVEALGYRGHEVLVEHLRGLDRARWRAALDLGCGTGLCGAVVRPIVDRLDGIDLSANMLEKARALGIYDALMQGDLAEHLGQTAQRYDLLLAADVFIYIGDLGQVFAGAHRVCEAGGIFCFSIELADAGGSDFVLQSSLRYRHAEAYLRRTALQTGFEWLKSVRQPIREDQRRPIPGLYVYLRKPAGAAAPPA